MPKASPAMMEIIGPPNKLGWKIYTNPKLLLELDQHKDGTGQFDNAEQFRIAMRLPRLYDDVEPVKFVEYAVVWFEKVMGFPMPDYSIQNGQFIIEED